MNKFQVYQIQNVVTGKRYIGYTTDYKRRWRDHLDCVAKQVNRCLYDAMNKYGTDNFVISVLFEFDSKIEATNCEIRLIEEFNTLMPNGYNMTTGGDGGNTLSTWTSEQKDNLYKRQASKRIGKHKSDQTKRKISEALIGREIDEGWRSKISATMREKGIAPPPFTYFQPGHQNQLGYKHTDEAKKKISESRLGKTYEEVYGFDRSIELKNKAKIRMSGKNNHQYVEISNQIKKEIVTFLSENRSSRQVLCEKYNISSYKIRQWMKEIGVDNYQTLYKENDETHWKEFWKGKLCLFP
jgi:group I intron endonuclease